jgi:hypothetical protein
MGCIFSSGDNRVIIVDEFDEMRQRRLEKI